MNLWHDLETGPDVPDVIHAVIEVPKGSRNKYEYSKKTGAISLDRVLFSPFHYPAEYGFIPQTFWGDGDPLDILVVMTEPTFPGCIIEARPIGVLKMLDKGESDYKVLAVPDSDPIYKEVRKLGDLPPHFLREVVHFFETYKQLEGKKVEILGWGDVEEAKQAVRDGIALYNSDVRGK
ncbi:MAG: inorganic diphosphatase [Anaerolineae bacterium]|jgi:inorganic pyrophosphatase|nr:inorganic diphosphatase [Anaerolineae bacterium]